ncbi:hypothetical protein Asphe3_38560 [Pseudarthrobacter phenanthrenivorans Sphe3]|uniref:Alpha/beta hydrolase n=1 Tax=Pseudarthrobacter phenanthrenivorans (strain DSM 18606 / JCM 16027 / LMG 23796 / Sphe3) TaxID=930171 RepID=F0M990_PSEPM|nr:hypothetical protein [Pseudarthrobacter phenanthrenivorans]ADX74944.1 hypothetical protein Asphe3_38560 [Pseudarthrobacter phenanthrenivorans Sphe3]
MAEATPSGSGGPIRVSGPADDGTLAIRGGMGGISFQLEELAGGTGKLDDLAGRLAAIEVEVRRIWEDLTPYQDLPRWTGTIALTAVWEAERSVRAVRTELQRISSQVRASKHEYEMAEWLAGAARGLGVPNVEGELERHADFWRTGFLNRSAAENIVGNATFVSPLLKTLADAVIPALRPRPLKVTTEESVPIVLDPSPSGLLERVRVIDERGAGYIEVIEVDGGGRRAYVVVIPGTQLRDAAEGANPFDLDGIVEGVGDRSESVNKAVREALEAAGARKGDPVVGVGFSQGGIHTMNLAASDDFLNEYDLQYVLTAGSPVAHIASKPDVSSLHLEHRTDWVPGADGAPNPDARNQVTVTMTNDLYVQTGEDVGIGPGHQLESYQEGARLVSQSGDPSLVESTAALGAILGTGGAATATRFSLSRTQAAVPDLHAANTRRRERGHGGR